MTVTTAKTTMTEDQRWAILNALRTAADAYRKDAESRAFKPEQYAHLRVACLRQADEAMALYEAIEQAEVIEFS